LPIVATKAEHYRQLARECFELANMGPLGEARTTILDMAREWEHLAEQQAHATDLRKKE
jgi:hypothetical protein